MPLALVLYQPDIAQNAGTLMRTGACLSVPVHIIHPAGFAFSAAAYRRAALDYEAMGEMIEHRSYGEFHTWRKDEGRRLVLLSTRGRKTFGSILFEANDLIMVGRETAGVPDSVASDADEIVRIPMRADVRSINVAMAGALVLSEAMRQTGQWAKLT
jgi:tRNA (cytidine/uridine-2'-O-)-methyltransferase